MSLLIKGITKLSELTIDAAKDWAAKKIENLGAPDSGDDAKRHDSTPEGHKTSHENTGGDEIGVGGLSGLLADGQTPLAHHTTHESGGADEIKDMELNNAPGTDDTGSGILTVGTVGEIVTAGQVLYLKADGKYWKAKADDIATMPGKVLAMAGIAASAAGKLLHLGYYRHDAWTFTVGNGTANLLYVDKTAAGLVTQAAPGAAGDQVQVIGYCISDDEIFFNPCLELVEIAA